MIEIKEKYIEKAVFVGVIKQGDDERQVTEYLDELEFLAETAGAEGHKRFIQKVDKPDSRTYIRSGKLEEIKSYIYSTMSSPLPSSGTWKGSFPAEYSTGQTSYWIFSPKGQRPPTQRHRLNSPSISICCLGLRGCGPTLNDRKEELE